ncbi:hypothetical protein [Mangrovimicrobium sediminis]|nr:hypothetical protein [Haliea sp. SAOS-164]
MRSRFHALGLAVAGSGSILFCWISAAILGLVTLRKGVGSGLQLMLWALLLPLVLIFTYGDSGPFTLLLGTTLLAVVLRTTVSLSLTLLGGVAVAALTGLGLLVLASAYLEQLLAVFVEFIASLEQQFAEGGQQVTLQRPSALQIAGLMGAGMGMSCILCLLLARYWQSALYNPGGFGSEFRALRYPPAVTAAMVLVAVAVSALGVEYRTWAVIASLPLNFVGLALVHARVQMRGMSGGWLVGFYLAWLLLDPVKLLMMVFAVVDSWLDFRRRWAGAEPPARGDG